MFSPTPLVGIISQRHRHLNKTNNCSATSVIFVFVFVFVFVLVTIVNSRPVLHACGNDHLNLVPFLTEVSNTIPHLLKELVNGPIK